MFYRLLLAFFFLLGAGFSLHGMIAGTRVYRIIEGNTEVRFVRECSKEYFKKKLNSNRVQDIKYCAEVCGGMLRNSIFNSTGKLDRIIAMIDPKNISRDMESDKMALVFHNANNSSLFGKVPAKEEDLPKLELFAPGIWSVDDWILKCNSVIGVENNYELSKFDENYTLEKALYILFAYSHTGFWASKDKIFFCIKYLCGAIRTYLHFVEREDITRPDFDFSKSSYFYILERCYNLYSSDVKKLK